MYRCTFEDSEGSAAAWLRGPGGQYHATFQESSRSGHPPPVMSPKTVQTASKFDVSQIPI